MNKITIAVALFVSAQVASAQGTDTCTTPQALVGPGPWAFDNTAATTGTQNQTESSCLQYGTTVIKNDVWFTWNATFSGFATLTTCGQTTVDTKLAIYAGTTCPTSGSALACNDDDCLGLESHTSAFLVTMGQNYVIQLGTYPGTTTQPGMGMFDILNVSVPSNDNCATPVAIAGPGQYAFDTSHASRDINVGQNETTCLINTNVTPIYRDLWYTYIASSNSVSVKTCNLIDPSSPWTDTRIAVYPGTACPAAQSSVACEDDSAACLDFSTELILPATCGATYLIQLGNYNVHQSTLGMLEFTELGPPCNTPTTPFCLGDGTGAPCPCTPTPNNGAPGRGCGTQAFPGGALLTSTGIASDETVSGPTADTLVLTASDIPGPALFIQSNGLISPTAFGDGQLCAAISIIRLGVVFPTGSTASYPGGLSPNEIHIQGSAAAGQTKHYQAWYRSVPGVCTSGQNYALTQGLSLVWGS